MSEHDQRLSPGARRLALIIGSIVLIGAAGGVGWFMANRENAAAPGQVIVSESQQPLQLPLEAGGYARDPNKAASPSADPDTSIESVAATYRDADGQDALIVLAMRPVNDTQKMLADLGATNVRQVGEGYCGRTAQDEDVCGIITMGVGVVGVRMLDQTPQELMDATEAIAAEM